MVRQLEVLRQLDDERRSLAPDGLVIEVLPHLTRLGDTHGIWRAVIYSALTEQNADAVIESEIAYQRSLGGHCEWKLFAHDRPADLMKRLEGHGFMPGPCEAV